MARTTVVVRPREFVVLDALTLWHGLDELTEKFTDFGRPRLAKLLKRFAAGRIVETSERASSSKEHAVAQWPGWKPSAAYFHFDTRDGVFADTTTVLRELETQFQFEPLPPAFKRVHGRRIDLPLYRSQGAFPKVLLSRRSWRRFGRGPIGLDDLSTLLGLTWATQKWLPYGNSSAALKTSPSGGACHSLEAYVAVRHVKGIRRGVYHYSPDGHSLTQLKHPWSERWLGKCLVGQTWCAQANAVVFMTSVFPRVQWKYRTSRAYRTVLLEAGHFCQTFCLTATWLGLAPFCTAALADSYIERALRIDGVTEAVLYVAGVGVRPRNSEWAPWPDASPLPTTTSPSYMTRPRAKARRSSHHG